MRYGDNCEYGLLMSTYSFKQYLPSAIVYSVTMNADNFSSAFSKYILFEIYIAQINIIRALNDTATQHII